MNKQFLFILLFFVNLSVFAIDEKSCSDSTFANKQSKAVLVGGFYIQIGLGSSSATVVKDNYKPTTVFSHGVQTSIEIGNQWLFVRKENWGIGMNVNWVTFSQNSYMSNNSSDRVTDFELNVLRLGPLASMKLSDKVSVDIFLNVSPTFRFNDSNENKDNNDRFSMRGLQYVNGFRVRYKKIALGLETQFGSLKGNYEPSPAYPIKDDAIMKTFNTRLTLGYKF